MKKKVSDRNDIDTEKIQSHFKTTSQKKEEQYTDANKMRLVNQSSVRSNHLRERMIQQTNQ